MTIERDLALGDEVPAAEARPADIPDHTRLLRGLRRVGWFLIVVQFVGFALWSVYLTSRASFGHDTAIYYQSWELIAHGHLLPRNTIQGGYYFWQNDGELILYLLAPLYWVFPNHLIGLLWLQDLAVSGTIAVCYKLVIDRWLRAQAKIERRELAAGVSAWTAILVLLLLDPWIYWVPSFDIHMESFGVFFVACAYAAFRNGHRRGYLYALLTAISGAASVVYVLSLGVLLAGTGGFRSYRENQKKRLGLRAWLRRGAIASVLFPGLVLAIGAVIWLLALTSLHGTKGSPTGGFVYLLGPTGAKVVHVTFGNVIHGLFAHPIAALRTFASHSWNLWANTSSAGFIGLLTPVGFWLAAPTFLLDNLLKGQQSSYPTFQNLPEFVFIALGTAVLLGHLIRRKRSFAVGLALLALVIANEVGWFAVWFPKTAVHWLRTTPAAATVLWRAERMIPSSAEVVMMNGVAGPFGGHVHLYEFFSPNPIPVKTRVVWFVMSPSQGIEVVPTAVTERAIGQVVSLPGARLVSATQGIYVIRWDVPLGYRAISLGAGDSIRAWTSPGVAARADRSGPPTSWHLVSLGKRGYLLDGDYWREYRGSYVAKVRLSSNGPLNIEVWDDTRDRLIARDRISAALHETSFAVPFKIGHVATGFVYQGAGAFRDFPIPQVPGEEIELRIWSSGQPRVEIFTASLLHNA